MTLAMCLDPAKAYKKPNPNPEFAPKSRAAACQRRQIMPRSLSRQPCRFVQRIPKHGFQKSAEGRVLPGVDSRCEGQRFYLSKGKETSDLLNGPQSCLDPTVSATWAWHCPIGSRGSSVLSRAVW